MPGNADSNEATPGELASIDESIEFVKYLESVIDDSHNLQREAERVYRVVEDLGNDLGDLVTATDELKANNQVSAGTAGEMVGPVEVAVADLHADSHHPVDIVELLIEHQNAMRSFCWHEDVEVMQAREQVEAEARAVSHATSHEDNLPRQLDEEIRVTQQEAHELRMTDPADHDLERRATEAQDEVPRASSRVNAAEDEVAQTRRGEDSARSALREAEMALDQARRESEAAMAAKVNAAQDEITEARQYEDSARSALREAEWELDQARHESDGAPSSRVSAAEDDVAQAHWHIDSALGALRDAESKLDRARRESDADGRLRGVEREHEDRTRQFEQAESGHRSAQDRLHRARSALIAAQQAEVDTRREADSARQRNMRQLESNAAHLDEKARGLISSRQGKLDRAREARLEAEERLQQAQARRDSAVAAACWARRDAERAAGRMSDLDKIGEGVARCAEAHRSLVAWGGETEPKCETLKSHAAQSASLLDDDIARTRRELNADESAVAVVDGKIGAVRNSAANVESEIEGVRQSRRRRYRQIWFIVLPATLLVVSPLLGTLLDVPIGIFGAASWFVTLALHFVSWKHHRDRLAALGAELEQFNAELATLQAERDLAQSQRSDTAGDMARLNAAVNCCQRISSHLEPVERFCRGVTGTPDDLPDDVRMFDADDVMIKLNSLRG